MNPTVSENISVTAPFWKATPHVEGGKRWVYCEPSNEATDLDNERMLRQALMDSADYFLSKGNLDIEHLTLLGQQKGIQNPRKYEIGFPVEVKFDEGRTFVKGEIYQGTGEELEQANFFWKSITEFVPSMRWFPSVGGHIRDTGMIHPKGAPSPVKAIKKVYWNNIGFAREPVNPTVPGVSVMAMGAFAKCWIGAGSTLEYTPILKTIQAGYGTSLPDLTGGGALRKESMQGLASYSSVADKLVSAMKSGRVKSSTSRLTPQDLVEHLMQEEQMSHVEAVAAVRQLLSHVASTRAARTLTHQSVRKESVHV
ncbi:MAG: hypothetical protein Q7U76_13030 [Nitrospirota bacterium]|nr:hypothetical protein [Nitrospirota bacterium]